MKCPKCGNDTYKSIGGTDICPSCGFGSASVAQQLAQEQEQDKPGLKHFTSLPEAVAFIADCLEAGSASALLTQIARVEELPNHARYLSEEIFPKLIKRHRELDLRQCYQDWTFPEDARTFALGGHDRELGCIHINFRKRAHGWIIYDVSECK